MGLTRGGETGIIIIIMLFAFLISALIAVVISFVITVKMTSHAMREMESHMNEMFNIQEEYIKDLEKLIVKRIRDLQG